MTSIKHVLRGVEASIAHIIVRVEVSKVDGVPRKVIVVRGYDKHGRDRFSHRMMKAGDVKPWLAAHHPGIPAYHARQLC